MSSVIINLQCLPESFQFEPKWIPLPSTSRVLLGSVNRETVVDPERIATTSNGFFPPIMPTNKGAEPITPLALSANHAEIWVKDHQVGLFPSSPAHRCKIYSPTLQVMLRDLDSPFGTFVNGTKVAGETVLKTGDVIVGRPLSCRLISKLILLPLYSPWATVCLGMTKHPLI